MSNCVPDKADAAEFFRFFNTIPFAHVPTPAIVPAEGILSNGELISTLMSASISKCPSSLEDIYSALSLNCTFFVVGVMRSSSRVIVPDNVISSVPAPSAAIVSFPSAQELIYIPVSLNWIFCVVATVVSALIVSVSPAASPIVVLPLAVMSVVVIGASILPFSSMTLISLTYSAPHNILKSFLIT